MLPIAISALLGASAVLAGPARSARSARSANFVAPLMEERDLGHLARRNTSCTFSGSSGYSEIASKKASCGTIIISALTVPAGKTLDLTELADGTQVTFEGTTTFAFSEWEGPLLAISGTSITVTGASGSILDGNGAKYWDGEGDDGVTKPKFFQAHDLTTSSITGITIKNSPVQVFSINGVDTLSLDSITIDNQDGDDGDLGANTDCFDIGSSTGVSITNAVCYNQDDCVAINSGTDITFSGGFCSGGHGLSIGSIGGRDDNTVSGVTFSSSTVENSQQGIRIKTKSGDTGTVKDITYKDITLSGMTDYGIIVDQAYDGDEATDGITISGFVLNGITGTVESDADYAIYVNCGSDSCTDWTWTDVSVTGAEDSCANQPSAVSCT